MKKILAAILIVVFCNSLSFADETLFKKIDKNKDGKISKKEYMEGVNKTFKSYDKNSSKSVTREELKTTVNVDVENTMTAADSNTDGTISQEEFLQSAEKRFKFFDKNNNGYIDKKEWDAELKRGNPNNPKASPVAPFISISF